MSLRHFVCFIALFAFGCTTLNISFVTPEHDGSRAGLDSGPAIAGDAGMPHADAFVAVDAFVGPDAAAPSLTVIGVDPIPASTIGKGSSYVALYGVYLMAGANDVTLEGLALERTGVGAASDFSNVFLFDMTSLRTRITTGRSINAVTNQVAFNGLSIVIPAGTTANLWIFGDVSTSAFTGDQHAFRLASADAITTREHPPIIGSFPATGSTMTIGSVSASRVILRAGSGADPVSGSIGVISQFTLAWAPGDVGVQVITLTQAGSITMSDLADPELYIDGVHGGSARIEGERIVLDLAPEFHWTGDTTFTLMARISAPSGRTIRTYVEYPVDVRAIDSSFDFTAAVCISPLAVGGCMGSGEGSFDGSTPGTYFEVTVR